MDDVARLQVLASQLVYYAGTASASQPENYAPLADIRSDIERTWQGLKVRSIDERPGEAGTASMTSQVATLETLWQRLDAEVGVLLENSEYIEEIDRIRRKTESSITEIQVAYDDVLEALLEIDASAATVAMAQRQSWVAERMSRSLSVAFFEPNPSPLSLDKFERDLGFLKKVNTGFIEGNPQLGIEKLDSFVQPILADIENLSNGIKEEEDYFLAHSFALPRAHHSAGALSETVRSMISELNVLAEYQSGMGNAKAASDSPMPASLLGSQTLNLISGLFGALCLLLLGVVGRKIMNG